MSVIIFEEKMENFVEILGYVLTPITGAVTWVAAKRSRDNNMLKELQASIDMLVEKNKELISEVTELRIENSELKAQVQQLRVENKELKSIVEKIQENEAARSKNI